MVISFAPGVRVMLLPAVIPFTASVGPVPSVTRLSVPPALVSVTDDAGEELVTVKLGYVPVTEISVPLAMVTVWSGAVFVTTGFTGSVLSTLIPVPATTESTCPPAAVLLIVMESAAATSDTLLPATSDFVARDGPVPSFTRLSPAPALVRVTVDAPSVLSIVNSG